MGEAPRWCYLLPGVPSRWTAEKYFVISWAGYAFGTIGIRGFMMLINMKPSPYELPTVEMPTRPDIATRVPGSDDPNSALKHKGFLWCYMSGTLVTPRS